MGLGSRGAWGWAAEVALQDTASLRGLCKAPPEGVCASTSVCGAAGHLSGVPASPKPLLSPLSVLLPLSLSGVEAFRHRGSSFVG